jgi:hypothetical protein
VRKALIFAADRSARWVDQPCPKQLFPVAAGEPILARTIRQLHERAVQPVVITNSTTIAACAAAAGAVVGSMLGLFGDVAWTDGAMNRLCSVAGFRFLGRSHISLYTGGVPEVFGWVWDPGDYPQLLEGLHAGLEHARAKDPDGSGYDYLTGAIWQPYRVICGIHIDAHCQVDDRLWLSIDDYTDDVDTPEAARELQQTWAAAGVV